MKFLLVLSLTAIFFSNGFSQEIAMNSSEISQFKLVVKQKIQAIKSLQLDFVQTKHLGFLSNDLSSKGHLFYAQKNVKWSYTYPDIYNVLFKNGQVLINDKGKISSVPKSNDLFKKINSLVAQSIEGNLFENPDFTATFYKIGKEKIVKLSPNNANMAKYIKVVTVYFSENAMVNKIRLTEASGDYTLLQFTNQKINIAIPSIVFNN
jgi:outer membrane lipoprotein carrier protein